MHSSASLSLCVLPFLCLFLYDGREAVAAPQSAHDSPGAAAHASAGRNDVPTVRVEQAALSEPRWELVASPENIHAFDFRDVAVDRSGHPWAAGRDLRPDTRGMTRLFCWREGTWVPVLAEMTARQQSGNRLPFWGDPVRGVWWVESSRHRGELGATLWRLESGQARPCAALAFSGEGRSYGTPVYVSRQGHVFNWYRTAIAVLRNNEWQITDALLGPSRKAVRVVDFSPDGPVYFVYGEKATVWDGRRFYPDLPVPGKRFGRYSAPCGSGVVFTDYDMQEVAGFEFRDGVLAPLDFSPLNGFLRHAGRLQGIWSSPNRDIWLAMGDRLPFKLARVNRQGVARCSDTGNIWRPPRKPWDIDLREICVSARGALWMTTPGRNIMRLRGDCVSVFGLRHGLACDEPIGRLSVTADGTLFATTLKGRVLRQCAGTAAPPGLGDEWSETTGAPQGRPDGLLRICRPDYPTGRSCWNGTSMLRPDGTRLPLAGLGRVRRILPGPAEARGPYVVSDRGWFVVDGDAVHKLSHQGTHLDVFVSGLRRSTLFCPYLPGEVQRQSLVVRSLWPSQGLIPVDWRAARNLRVSTWSSRPQIAENQATLPSAIRAFADNFGGFWVTTNGKGTFRVIGETVLSLPDVAPVTQLPWEAMVVDDSGHLWVSVKPSWAESLEPRRVFVHRGALPRIAAMTAGVRDRRVVCIDAKCTGETLAMVGSLPGVCDWKVLSKGGELHAPFAAPGPWKDDVLIRAMHPTGTYGPVVRQAVELDVTLPETLWAGAELPAVVQVDEYLWRVPVHGKWTSAAPHIPRRIEYRIESGFWRPLVEDCYLPIGYESGPKEVQVELRAVEEEVFADPTPLVLRVNATDDARKAAARRWQLLMGDDAPVAAIAADELALLGEHGRNRLRRALAKLNARHDEVCAELRAAGGPDSRGGASAATRGNSTSRDGAE